jgi:phosphoribosylformylglycinamidine synthase subunit PurQ / glutaminase
VARVKACVVTGFGVNADEELALAFEMAGARARRVHEHDLAEDPRQLGEFQILAFPGGFSFGDHLGSGKVFATLFRRSLGAALEKFISRGGLVIGVCNGFQALVKMGFLPDLGGTHAQEVSLIHNDSGRFEDRWVRVGFENRSPCLWTRGLPDMDLPVRHGEGKFVTESSTTLAELESRNLVALRYLPRAALSDAGATACYPDDPNGSTNHIAGICDPTGRVFGLMPHPEAFLYPENHPEWTRKRPSGSGGLGLAVFRNGVRAAREARA